MLRSAPMFSVRSAGQRVTPLLIALVVLAGIIPPAVAQEPVNIVVTIPVLKDLTEQI
jgi:ABC-type Zn uptake system ZnuABC Zn-binding protein ZnuA